MGAGSKRLPGRAPAAIRAASASSLLGGGTWEVSAAPGTLDTRLYPLDDHRQLLPEAKTLKSLKTYNILKV